MGQHWTRTILLPVALLATAGCATRDWVRELVGKQEAEIDQRFAGVEKRLAEDAERIEGLHGRLETVETSLTQTGQVARSAQAQAEEAAGRLARRLGNLYKRDLVETVEVRFGFDRWDLDDTAQTALASLVKEVQANPRLSVDLEGYADPTGTFAYNVGLSQRRVEAVRRYLVEKGIELPRIQAVGLGPITAAGLPDEKKRRVTVRMMVQAD
jgi:outer membrane protein OmpA-like peptidoglycan-associated protein